MITLVSPSLNWIGNMWFFRVKNMDIYYPTLFFDDMWWQRWKWQSIDFTLSQNHSSKAVTFHLLSSPLDQFLQTFFVFSFKMLLTTVYHVNNYIINAKADEAITIAQLKNFSYVKLGKIPNYLQCISTRQLELLLLRAKHGHPTYLQDSTIFLIQLSNVEPKKFRCWHLL